MMLCRQCLDCIISHQGESPLYNRNRHGQGCKSALFFVNNSNTLLLQSLFIITALIQVRNISVGRNMAAQGHDVPGRKVKMGKYRPSMDFTKAKNVLGLSSNLRLEEIMPDILHSRFVAQLTKVLQ